MKISIIVPAAGCGARANLSVNKILAPIHGKPLIWWTLRALLQPEAMPEGAFLCEVIIAGRQDELEVLRSSAHPTSTPLLFVVGGADRQGSVANAAAAAQGELLMVHDAARPLVSAGLIQRVCRAAILGGAAIAALPAADTVKVARAEGPGHLVAATLERKTVWLAQTPQAFRRELLMSALRQAELDGFQGTDCASMVERLPGENGRVALVEGEPRNIKVTYPEDLTRAAMILGP